MGKQELVSYMLDKDKGHIDMLRDIHEGKVTLLELFCYRERYLEDYIRLDNLIYRNDYYLTKSGLFEELNKFSSEQLKDYYDFLSDKKYKSKGLEKVAVKKKYLSYAKNNSLIYKTYSDYTILTEYLASNGVSEEFIRKHVLPNLTDRDKKQLFILYGKRASAKFIEQYYVEMYNLGLTFGNILRFYDRMNYKICREILEYMNRERKQFKKMEIKKVKDIGQHFGWDMFENLNLFDDDVKRELIYIDNLPNVLTKEESNLLLGGKKDVRYK